MLLITIVLIGLLLWVLFLLIKTSKNLTSRPETHNWTETSSIIILLIAGVIILPWFFTQTVFSVYNMSETGQIGDTIGGITAPFINGLGAVLIYIAFKEQVKSGNSAREEKRLDLIIANLNKLEEDPYKISKLCQGCLNDLNGKDYQSKEILNLIRLLQEFQSISEFISELTDNKKFVENKLFLTWKMTYEPHIRPINKRIVSISIISGISFLFGNPDTFSGLYLKIEKTVDGYN